MAFSRTPSEGRDILRTTGTNQTISGLSGSDRISSTHSGSKLFGGDGKDWLVTTLHANVTDSDNVPKLTAEQDGGDGNDRMSITAIGESSIYGKGAEFTFDLTGGAGADEIWLEIDGDEVAGTATVDSGGDDDMISSSVHGTGDNSVNANSITAGKGDDIVFAYSTSGFLGMSENTVWGGDGDDDIESINSASYGTNKVYGGNGNDRLVAEGNSNAVNGGDGNDTVILKGKGVGDFPNVDGKAYGNDGDDILTATAVAGSSFSSGSSASTTLYGGNGADKLTATTTFEDDDSTGGAKLYGGSGADSLRVYGGTDNRLDGGAGNDTLTGGGADDVLIGGSGADELKGGRGDDTFRYLWMTGTKAETRDTILDFGFGSKSRGDDVIDLSKIDANTGKSGDQAFKFGGTTKTGTGYVWIEEDDSGSGSLVKADNGGSEDLVIAVDDGAGTTSADWSASDMPGPPPPMPRNVGRQAPLPETVFQQR